MRGVDYLNVPLFRHFLGIGLSIFVGHSVALEGVLFNLVGSESSFKCVFYMSLWLLLFSGPFLSRSTQKWAEKRDVVKVGVAAIGMGVALTLSITSYKYAPVADAFTLYYSNAVFSLAMESVVMRSWPKKLHIAAVCLVIAGIIFVSRPPFLFAKLSSTDESRNLAYPDETRFLGCILAIAAAITTSIWMTFLRRIHNLNILFVTWLQALVPVVGYAILFGLTSELFCIKGDLLMLALLCLNYSVNLPALNLCLKLEPSYVVTSVRCLATVTSFFIQMSRGIETPWTSFLGAVSIIISVLIVSYTKWKEARQQISQTRYTGLETPFDSRQMNETGT